MLLVWYVRPTSNINKSFLQYIIKVRSGGLTNIVFCFYVRLRPCSIDLSLAQWLMVTPNLSVRFEPKITTLASFER